MGARLDFDGGDEWLTAARENLELLRLIHDVSTAELEDAATISYDARAALHLRRLELKARLPWAPLATTAVERYMRQVLPYDFVPGQRIVSVHAALLRGYWACADTSAAAAAVFVGGRRPVMLCTETVEGLAGYAHSRLVVSGSVVEPWPEARRPEARGCTLLDDVSALLLAPST